MTRACRLDFTYPDGSRRSHVVSGDSITLGSVAGNTILIADGELAPRQLRLEQRAGQLYLTSLAPGTLLDGLPAPVNAATPLQNGARIQAGALEILVRMQDESATVASPAVSEATLPMETGFRAALDRSLIPVFPFSSAWLELKISNLEAVPARFAIEVAGLPPAWLSPGQAELNVAAEDSATLGIQIAPGREPMLPAGEYPMAVSIIRLDKGQTRLRLEAVARLGGIAGLSLRLDKAIFRRGERFSLEARNLGNRELPLSLGAHDRTGLLEIQLETDRATLAPGELRRIQGRARPRNRHLFGAPLTVPFAILARTRRQQFALPAKVAVKPRITGGRLLATALVFSVLTLLGLPLLPGAEPSIQSFTLEPAVVARGTPARLTWAARHAERFVIELDRAPVAELPGDAADFRLPTDNFTGPAEVALLAIGGERQALETRPLTVYQPVIVHRFEADKAVMLRNVVAELAVRWEVEGAIALSVASPPGFETLNEPGAAPALGLLQLRGAPGETFEVALIAEDERGNKTERVLRVAMREPECLPRIDALLYAGPDRRFRLLNAAAQTVPALVHGRAGDGKWLLLELASGTKGWGAVSDFDCPGFAIEALRVIADAPQPQPETGFRPPAPIRSFRPR